MTQEKAEQASNALNELIDLQKKCEIIESVKDAIEEQDITLFFDYNVNGKNVKQHLTMHPSQAYSILNKLWVTFKDWTDLAKLDLEEL